jgi:hypothetical protein
MTDVLIERFAALADTTNDGDWLDVRRRARRGRSRYAVPALAAAAAVVAAAALAAGGGWLFSARNREVTAVTHVQLHGQDWRVSVTTGGRLRFCVRASQAGNPALSTGCSGKPGRMGPPFGARHLDVTGGQIWVGATVGFTRRIAITDTAGKVHTATAVRGTKTPFRYWIIALDGTNAQSIAAYDARGRVIRKTVG